ncbi:MAG: hypothetical protein COS08_07920 [Euryarchaeota archaeon CG01_land_8_20_14_3_00_38_12]|nr:MAG: hypothetical protein COS08_07920 [Euryarchaeota archaeon CG01_land_8_20_14_3_00_38_12]PJB21181.1 MAG: hypothetical protein CO114_06700 [Euryarchaeota archaeon CG_4_9_14_3_um_filter_38_12]
MMTLPELGQIAVLIIIICTAYAAIKFKDLLAAVISLAIMSLLLSLEFYILQAPDVAIAEAAIGAGLTTAIYILAIRGTRRMEEE